MAELSDEVRLIDGDGVFVLAVAGDFDLVEVGQEWPYVAQPAGYHFLRGIGPGTHVRMVSSDGSVVAEGVFTGTGIERTA